MEPRERKRVAVVDDEPSIRETLTMALEREHYAVEVFEHGLRAWSAFRERLPDLIVLDVSMPHLDGLEVCKNVRSIDARVPILFLSSREEELDRILALELGGDDYVTKPFSLRELLVRVKVLLRRTAPDRADVEGSARNVVAIGEFEVDEPAFELRYRGIDAALTVTEFRIVAALLKTPLTVKSREQLIEAAYAEKTFVEPRTMDTHVKRIRRKFEAIDQNFAAIVAVPGLGYKVVL